MQREIARALRNMAIHPEAFDMAMHGCVEGHAWMHGTPGTKPDAQGVEGRHWAKAVGYAWGTHV